MRLAMGNRVIGVNDVARRLLRSGSGNMLIGEKILALRLLVVQQDLESIVGLYKMSKCHNTFN